MALNARTCRPVRVCIVYDCLFPHTVGGAERWYRNLSEELARAGHDVTYLTRRQWPKGEQPAAPAGVRVVSVSRGGPLYTADGRRTVGPPLRFGLGVLRHLATRRRRYDAVHVCSFPYFSLLAVVTALARTPVLVGVDWFEVWTSEYWRTYLGPMGGAIGWAVQRACAQLTPTAFVFSRVHAARLGHEGLSTEPVRLAGLYTGPLEPQLAPTASVSRSWSSQGATYPRSARISSPLRWPRRATGSRTCAHSCWATDLSASGCSSRSPKRSCRARSRRRALSTRRRSPPPWPAQPA